MKKWATILAGISLLNASEVALKGNLYSRQATEFEAVSIRLVGDDYTEVPSGTRGEGVAIKPCQYLPDRISCQQTLPDLLAEAFQIRPSQIVAPKNMPGEAVQLQGIFPLNESKYRIREMIRNTLIRRFAIKFHYEKRKVATLALRVDDKRRPLLEPADEISKRKAINPNLPQAPPSSIFYRPGRFSASAITLDALAEAIQSHSSNLPVINQTGLNGAYKMDLRWEPSTANSLIVTNNDTDFIKAIERTLHLKVVKQVSTLDMLIIDSINRFPEDN